MMQKTSVSLNWLKIVIGRKFFILSSRQILLFSFHSLVLHVLQVYLSCEIWFYLFYKCILILKSFIKMLHCTHPDVLCVKSFRLCTADAFVSNLLFFGL